MTDETWIKFKQTNELTGEVEIKSGTLQGMTATKCAIETIDGIQMVQNEDVIEGWYF